MQLWGRGGRGATLAWLVWLASLTAALATLAAAPTPAQATEAEVGVFSGWHQFAGTNELGQPEDLDAGIDSAALIGLRLGLWPWRFFGLELEGTALRSSMTTNLGAELVRSDVVVGSGRLHAVGRLPLGRVELLAFAGGGAARTFPTVVTEASVDTDAFSEAGLGASVRLWRRLHLRADLRLHLTGSTVAGAGTSRDAEATLGASWRFGTPPTAADADADHDGVADDPDRCPFEPETHNGVRDDDGCPEHPSAVLRYHQTRFVAGEGAATVARLAPERTAAGREAAAAAPPLEASATTAPALDAARERERAVVERALRDLERAAKLADDALPPLVSAGDDDGDGLDRDEDVCPDEAEDVDGFEDSDGCPDPDNDGDGVPDDLDQCPFEAETRNGVRDDDGCPEHPALALRYHQTRFALRAGEPVGVVPEQAERLERRGGRGVALPGGATLTVLPEPQPLAPGALPPLVSAGDDDGDGLERDDDVCPAEAEDRDGFEDGDGCPEPDNDRDSVPDGEDRCPLEGETQNGFEDDDGCPDEVPRPLAERVGRMAGVVFANNSARILPESEPPLRRVLEVALRYPSIRIEIAGHTDNVGSRESNLVLSQLRAASVRAYLVLHGIDDKRIRARGYGPDQPVASNRSAKGRALNRRVEFQLVPGDRANSHENGQSGPQASDGDKQPRRRP